MPNQALVNKSPSDKCFGLALSQLKFGVLEVHYALTKCFALFDKVDGHSDCAFHFHHSRLSNVQTLLG